MAISPLNQLAAGQVSNNLHTQQSRLAATIQNLASGNRLSRAVNDIASLSAATALQSEVTGLRAASLNVAQASSLLQVADGGIGQIGGILDRLSALSVQANSGALSKSGREGLNAEFQGLTQEINRLAGNTNFNGVSLLNGSLSTGGAISTSTAQGAKASGSLNFTANAVAGQTVNLNGVSLVAGVDFAVGASAIQTTQNLATSLNSDARFDGFSFSSSGATLNINAEVAGSAGNQFTINKAASTTAFTVAGDTLTGANVFSLQGGTDTGLSSGDTTVSGTVGNNLVSGLNNSNAKSELLFNTSSDIQAGNSIQIDNGEGGFTTFNFVNGAPVAATDIQIGSTLEETLNNAASTLENFSGAGDFGTRQLDFSVQNGNRLVIQSEQPGNPTDVTGAALNVNLATAGGSASTNTLNNGSTGGIDVSNVTSAGFTGTIQGFNATFNGVADQANVSVQVGSDTFTATINNTNGAANQTVTFTSANGGSFDVTLAGGNGQAINNQADANQFATRLNAAFSTVNFSQNRDISSFNGTGQLTGASAQINSSSVAGRNIDNINVTASGGSSRIEINVDGQIFRSTDLRTGIAAGERVTLQADNGDTITFNNGQNQINLNNNADAATLQSNLNQAFGTSGGSGLPFQVGSSSGESVNLSIGNLSTSALFNGQNLDLLSVGGAQAAFAAIGNASRLLASQRADVGAFQEALNFTAANIDSAIQNQDAARSVLADTDFASESSLNALLQTQSKASIATLAQTNRLSSNLLRLIG